MGKLRVHELAKKLNMSNQDMIAKLNARGIIARTHSSSVDEQAALKALGLSQDGEAGSALRPRTVLRRRKEAAELEGIEEIGVPKEPETNAKAPQEPGYVKVEPALERVEIVSAHNPETKAEVPPKAIVDRTLEPKPVMASEGVAKVISPSNVVRVIDADAIKARLASEGRTFHRRHTPGQRPQPQEGGYRRPGEGRPAPDFAPAPIALPDAGAADANKPGMRHAKKKKSGASYSRDMRESSSGGRELWVTPGKKRKTGKVKGRGPVLTQAAAHKRVIEMTDAITVNDLAHRMAIKASQVVSKLLSLGMMVTVNEAVDFDTASIIAQEFGFEIKNVAFEETDLIKEETDKQEDLVPRSPIVTVMGHVDHGKTSLLDAIRKSSVVSGEAGGITQHIGAYSVPTSHGLVTFLDTPGHEAFTSMRARGAQVTDIVILVVAADDGVMPQTKEAVDHAKAAKVPVVVAINKIDVPDAKPERVMQQLSEFGLVPEEWGGDTQFYKVSALKKTGLNELVEGLSVLAEVLELRANPNKPMSGCVIEAKLDKGRGPVATILPQSGTLSLGDYLVAGECMGRVRGMFDSSGLKVDKAGPSFPVQVLGLSAVPLAGDSVNVVLDDKTAKTISQHRAQQRREKELLKNRNVSLENFLAAGPAGDVKTLRLIVKADVFGSAEALSASLSNLSTKEVKVDIIHSGVGTITESNVNLALASGATIIGFNIKADGKAAALAAQEKVDVRYYSVIYEALDDVRKAMAGLLAPVYEEIYLGKAEVRMIISVSKAPKIAGSYVLDGKIARSAKVRLLRDNKMVFEGNIGSLKRFKDDVKEVSAGYECGIGVDGFGDIREGDILECFELKQVEAKLSESLKSLEADKKGKPHESAAAH